MHRREEEESEAAVLAERLLAEEPDEDVEAPPASSAMAPLDEKKPGGASLRAGWFRIMQEARHVRPQLLVGCLFLVGGSVSKNALPFLSGRLLDCVTEGTAAKGDAAALSRAHHKLNVVCLQLAGGALVTGVLSAIRAYLFNSASERVVAAVRSKLFRSLLRQELAFYDVNTSGALISRISADTEALKDAGTTNVSILFRSFVDLIVSLALMLYTSWRLTLLSLAITPLAAIVVATTGRRLMKLAKDARTAAAEGASAAADAIGSMRLVKATGREAAESAVFDKTVAATLSLGMAAVRGGSVFTAFAITVLGCVVAAVFWYGATQVLLGRMTLGSLQAFILYALGIGGAFAGISGTFISTLTAIGASQRVFELIDRTPDLPPSGSLRPFTQLHTIPLELREVWFAFPSRPQAWVLRNVSFRVPAGDTVALVGPSGAGKSTVVALVERFYDVQRGVVLLADTPVAQIDSQHLHSGLGYVSQEPLLLARSIRDNITFGVDSASDAEVAAAAAAANASEFIDRYEKGYDTQVGERGVQLSGGQKQRIAIARAVLAHPKLLLLDEATSAQDAETEAVVTEALQRLMKGRSALVIAHRLSTVRDAANIIVMVGGKVEEQGTHEELLGRSDGVYANLVHRQLDG